MRLVDKLDRYYKAGADVILIGEHGVGKTSAVKQVFESNGLKLGESWFYFSASTLDPWVDFIGIPKEKEENGVQFVELIRPKAFADSSKIEALFIDEYNRAPKKIRNAVMELIQFKSINGKKFPNLKVVWTAINPEDENETYDVEKLDPAQRDRFVVPVDVPYACDKEYFKNKYGEEKATISIDWWNNIPDDIKRKVSPRRLDYALNYMEKGIPLEDILPQETNVNKLRQALANGPIDKKLRKLFEDKNEKEAKLFLAVENNFSNSIKYIENNKEYIEFFVPLLKKEKISLAVSEDGTNISEYIIKNFENNKIFKSIIENVLTAGSNPVVIKKIREYYQKNETEIVRSERKADLIENNFYLPYVEKYLAKMIENINSHKSATKELPESVMETIVSSLPETITQSVASSVTKFIDLYFSNKWEESLRSLNLNAICETWNKCYDVCGSNELGSREFWNKCKTIGIDGKIKGNNK